MALVLGTNCGFVSSAPVADPLGSNSSGIDEQAKAIRDVSSSDAIKVIEIGWWCDNATEESNFEVGLYSNEGNDEPETRLFVDTTNAKGTGAGWKTVAVDWEISPSTTYWIAFQLDDTTTTTNSDFKASDGPGYARHSLSDSSLPADWGTSQFKDTNGKIAVYAVWEAGATDHTTQLSETMVIADSLSHQTEFKVLLDELQSITDDLSSKVEFNVNLDDTINITDDLTETLTTLKRVLSKIYKLGLIKYDNILKTEGVKKLGLIPYNKILKTTKPIKLKTDKGGIIKI